MVKAKRHAMKYMLIGAAGCAVIGLGFAVFSFMRSFLSGGAPPPQKSVQVVQLIRPPPPPPDLPPPPPPPPEEKIDIPDPQQQPDPTDSKQPPPSQNLGLDAEGTAGGDAFGLVGNKGGRDLVGSGGSAFAWYAGLLKNEILDRLQSDNQLRSGQFTVMVRMWVREDGSVDHVRIVESSGDSERDRAIEATLSNIARLSQAPPADMPEPISLRIVSRG